MTGRTHPDSGRIVTSGDVINDLHDTIDRRTERTNMTQNINTTSGAADLLDLIEAYAEARHCKGHSSHNAQTAAARKAVKDALAAGQTTAAQAVVQDDLITIRKPTTRAEMLWLLKLAHLVISDVDKTLEETFSPAQPAAEAPRFGSPELQAMIIARCVEKDQADSVPAVEREQERIAFKDAHRHLELDEVPDAWGRPMFKHSHVEASWLGWIARASHGQVPAGAGEAAEHYRNAIARARLLDSDLSNLTERGAKAWTGVDAQALREGGASPSANAGEPSGHIKEPYTLAEIKAKIASNDYSAEMLLQHAMLLLDSVQEDAARLDFLIEQRAYVVSDPDACPGYWLHWARPDGRTWVQGDEHPTPRAAIDAGRKQGARWQSAVRPLTLHI